MGLATNFRAETFHAPAATALLWSFAASANDARLVQDGRRVALPVRLGVHDSLFVPLSKGSMLLAGNYRCLTDDGIRSIGAAVHDDVEKRR